MKFRLSSWITALALAVAGIGFTADPATAASAGYCTGSGVNVVVDFGALGGGVQKGCGQGSTATPAFESAGFAISYSHTGGMNGFVCTVAYQNTNNAQPSNLQCSGANGQGYWALFVASPGGSWSYANFGADSQTVNTGQTVAFAWQSGSEASGGGHRNPSASPAAALKKSTRTPTPKPTQSGVHVGSSTHPTTAASSTPSPSATAPAKHHKHARQSAAPTPSATATASATPSATVTQGMPIAKAAKSNGGLPWWIPVGVVVLLLIGAGYAWWRKRVQG